MEFQWVANKIADPVKNRKCWKEVSFFGSSP